MQNPRLNLSLKTAIAIVAASWFAFTFFEFVSAVIHASSRPWYIMVTDTLGSVGLGFRAAGGFVAIITIASYFFLRKMGKAEALMSFRWVLLLEAFYYAISFIPAALWGVSDNPFSNANGQLGGNLLVNFVPCMIAGILMPIVLVKFFSELGPNKPSSNAVKWGLITGTAYVFLFWFTNMCDWIYAVNFEGINYLLLPANLLNLFSFLLTTVGLLVLTVYAAYFSRKSVWNRFLDQTYLRKVGVIVTSFGTYFVVIYMLWIYFGSVGGWSPMVRLVPRSQRSDLYLLTLPLAGLPLLFWEKPQEQARPSSAA